MTKEEKNQDKTSATDAAKDKKDGDKKMLDDKGRPLTEQDIALFKRYGKGPYSEILKKTDEEVK